MRYCLGVSKKTNFFYYGRYMAAQQLDNGKKMFIGIDLDGVVVNHARSRIRFAALHGFPVAPEETPSEIIKTFLPEPVLLRLQHALYNDPDTNLRGTAYARSAQGFTGIYATRHTVCADFKARARPNIRGRTFKKTPTLAGIF